MDVGIVGAGPAGCFCAERLARAGHAVTLYDPSHPREKPCGGGLTPGAYRRHPELAEIRPLGRAASRVRLRGPRAEELAIALPQPIDVFSRRVLDAHLLERACAAGARLHPVRVKRVRLRPRGMEVDLGDTARVHDFVVGADGAASVVRRSLLGERPGARTGYATAGFFVEGLEETDLYVEFVPDYAGYLWVFPRPCHASVGIAAPVGLESGAKLRARVLRMLEARYPGSLALSRRSYGASIPCATPAQHSRPRLGGPRFALVGDAANAVDAITGEGIQHALESGATLAAALDAEGPLAAAEEYARRWSVGPGRELARASRWAERYYGPRTVSFAMGVAQRSARARRIMADLLAVLQPYSCLPRRVLRELLGPAAS
jgi:flavin-dependent dehydrogenase